MTKSAKSILIIGLLLVLAALTCYCVVLGKPTEESAVQTEEEQTSAISAEEALAEAEKLASAAEAAYEKQTAVVITLGENQKSADTASVETDGNTVTVKSAGIYCLSGTLTDGQLVVDTTGDVTLILDGVDITNADDAAISVENAEHILIYLPEGSENRLVSGTETEITAASENQEQSTAEGAALYARDNLSFAGAGTLTVGGYIHNGIATTDRLTVLGGTLRIEALNNGLKGKDSVVIMDGSLDITSGNDGIKANNDADADCGSVKLCGGTVRLTTLGDGVQAAEDILVEGGTIEITTGDAGENTAPDSGTTASTLSSSAEEQMPGNMPQLPGGTSGGEETEGKTMPQLPGGSSDGMTPPTKPDGDVPEGDASQPQLPTESGETGDQIAPESGDDGEQKQMGGGFGDFFDRAQGDSSDTAASTKGLKSGGDLTVTGGSITIDATDDCLHADGSISLSGGVLSLASGDDGVHAEDTLTLDGAAVTVTEAYEGLEAHLIYVRSGDISITASDDGMNANGGSSMFGGMFSAQAEGDDSTPTLQITGGTVYVNAGGDGLDSNGDLLVEGGSVIVDGPSDNGNGALDAGTENGGSLLCSGGTLLAIGGSGMAESFESDSTQPSFIYNFNSSLSAGSVITVSDADGRVIFTHTAKKAFNSVVFTDAALTIGSTVTLTAGDQTVEIAIDGVTNGNASSGGMGGGFGGFGRK